MNTGSAALDGKKFSKYFLTISFIVSLLAIIWLVRPFLLDMTIAVIIAVLIFPLYRILLRLTRGRGSLASLVCCAVVVFAVFLPLAFTVQVLIEQGLNVYHSAGADIQAFVGQGSGGISDSINASWVGRWLTRHNINIDWVSLASTAINHIGAALASGINALSRTTISAFFDLFIILFSLFYFLRDGEQMLLKIKQFIPISDEYKERIIDRFYTMTNALIKGVIVIALLQSFLATLTLWAFGVNGWMILGVVMLVLAVIPFVGTGFVLVPVGIIKIVHGDIAQGVLIIIISIFLISLIDNILRPRIVGRHAGMHNLLVFLSMIGGSLSLGPAGLMVGPLLAAVFLTILDIYRAEFQCQFESIR